MTARSWLYLSVFSTLLSNTAAAMPNLELQGTLYRLGSNRQEKLYTWKMKTCGDLWTSNYYRLDGSLAVEDTTRFQSKRLAEYSYVRHTIGERASVKVRGERIEFRYELAGQNRSETLTTSDVFLTGPAVFAFIEQHLGELLAGKEFQFKFGVLDRLDYFTFDLSGEQISAGKGARIKVRASSVFVRMAVDPIYVTLSKGGRFRGIAGRTIVMEKIGGKRTPIDADLVVESEAPANCVSSLPKASPATTGAKKGAAE